MTGAAPHHLSLFVNAAVIVDRKLTNAARRLPQQERRNKLRSPIRHLCVQTRLCTIARASAYNEERAAQTRQRASSRGACKYLRPIGAFSVTRFEILLVLVNQKNHITPNISAAAALEVQVWMDRPVFLPRGKALHGLLLVKTSTPSSSL